MLIFYVLLKEAMIFKNGKQFLTVIFNHQSIIRSKKILIL